MGIPVFCCVKISLDMPCSMCYKCIKVINTLMTNRGTAYILAHTVFHTM